MKDRTGRVTDDWMTPPDWYNEWHRQFKFLFDPCPMEHDLSLWDGLEVNWRNRNFVNPPYHRSTKEAFVMKGIEEYEERGKFSFFTLPVSTSSKIFHREILPRADIYMVIGRIPYIGRKVNKKTGKLETVNYHLIGKETEVKGPGQFDTMIVLFGREALGMKEPPEIRNASLVHAFSGNFRMV